MTHKDALRRANALEMLEESVSSYDDDTLDRAIKFLSGRIDKAPAWSKGYLASRMAIYQGEKEKRDETSKGHVAG